MGNSESSSGKFGKLSQIRKDRGVRPRKKKGPHLFWDEKLGNFSKIRKAHPENSEKIRKVPQNSESSSGKLEKNSESWSGKFGKMSQIRKVQGGETEKKIK